MGVAQSSSSSSNSIGSGNSASKRRNLLLDDGIDSVHSTSSSVAKKSKTQHQDSAKSAPSVVSSAPLHDAKPGRFVGSIIQKTFQGYGTFLGVAMSYKHPYYKVKYEDGDQEDLSEEELQSLFSTQKLTQHQIDVLVEMNNSNK